MSNLGIFVPLPLQHPSLCTANVDQPSSWDLGTEHSPQLMEQGSGGRGAAQEASLWVSELPKLSSEDASVPALLSESLWVPGGPAHAGWSVPRLLLFLSLCSPAASGKGLCSPLVPTSEALGALAFARAQGGVLGACDHR